MNIRTISIRTNSRVRQAFARRDIYLGDFDSLKGELTTNQEGATLFLADINLNVYLRRIKSKKASYAAIGTGSANKITKEGNF
jgi:hypothetical protein